MLCLGFTMVSVWLLSWSLSWGCAQEFEDWKLALGKRREAQTQLTVRGVMKGKDSQ